jgi:PDZ domain-containing secreted protein
MAGMENMFVFSALAGFLSLPFLVRLPDGKKDLQPVNSGESHAENQ